jgi:hypothetical protein
MAKSLFETTHKALLKTREVTVPAQARRGRKKTVSVWEEGMDIDPLTNSPLCTTRATDLLIDQDFITFSEQLFAVKRSSFTSAELAVVAYIHDEVTERMHKHIHTHPQLNLDHRARYVWDYARHNISRVLAWKAMQGVLDLAFDVPDDGERSPLKCFLRLPEACMLDDVRALPKGKVWGSYLVWDTFSKVYVRTGKAVDMAARLKQHDKAVYDYSNSLFYNTFNKRWNDLTFYVSFGIKSKAQVMAASGACYIEKTVQTRSSARAHTHTHTHTHTYTHIHTHIHTHTQPQQRCIPGQKSHTRRPCCRPACLSERAR